MKHRSLFIVPVLIVSCTVALARTDWLDKTRGRQVERTVVADPNVVVSLCLMSGSIRVHGWDRNQVRARSNDTAEIELRRTGAPNDSDPARKLTLVIANTTGRHESPCLSDSDIELEVPRGATLKLQTRDGDVSVADIAKAYVLTQAGEVSVERVTQVVDATSIGGNISLRNCNGSIKVRSVGGNIEARSVGPGEVGDMFQANTVTGDIAVDLVRHAQLNASTVSGSLSVSGPLARGGRYGFNSISGDLTLSLPENSSFRLSATISRGAEMITDFPLTLTESAYPNKSAMAVPGAPDKSAKPAKKDVAAERTDLVKGRDSLRHINAIYGSGDALISFSSLGGTVHLRKK